MAPKVTSKPSARLQRAKAKRGDAIAKRLDQIAASKKSKKGKKARSGGYSRKELEALRDARG